MAHRLHFTAASIVVSLLVACSNGQTRTNDGTIGSGPVDGEIPGSGVGSSGGATSGGAGSSYGAASGSSGSSSAGGSGGGGGWAGGTSGAGGSEPSGTGGAAGGAGDGGYPGTGGIGATGGIGGIGGTGGIGGIGGGPPVIGPGVLTAGVWDDNRNFDRFLGYRAELADAETKGLLEFSVAEHEASNLAASDWLVPHERLDIALVIDTTGSMGDEMEYLKKELIAISATIAKLHPYAEQRWALIVYRDATDEYLVRWFGFRDSVEELQQKLTQQFAEGGGDFPEAPHAAFAQLNQLYWRAGADVSRLAFWLADAPHHDDKAASFTAALRKTRDLGIHVYPIASSGVDEPTELAMRSAAQITGGRYMFLTDDSGVGGEHKEPSIPCYFVTKLDDAMIRMVDIEMSGVYREPSANQIIRTGGNPKYGTCTLETGGQAVVF